jgi:Fe-S-cluster containining protein
MSLTPIKKYQRLIARVDEAGRAIQERYADQIACRKGCAGNCCRIHLSIFAIEAVALAHALIKLPRESAQHIRTKARNTTGSGPCPLLEDGACLMYASRLIICRTHGLPMRTEYRGQQSVGFCQKNFQHLNPVPDDAVMDLDRLNAELASLNGAFVEAYRGPVELRDRLTIGEALLLDFANQMVS